MCGMPQKRLGPEPLTDAERQARYKARKAASRDLGMPPADGENTQSLIQQARNTPKGVGGVMLRALWRREFHEAANALDVLYALVRSRHLIDEKSDPEALDHMHDELAHMIKRLKYVGRIAEKQRFTRR
jgi:hypothetical protein